MEVEAQVAHFLRFSPACSVGGPRCLLELGHPAGSRPLSWYPRHPMCSPQLLRLHVRGTVARARGE
eukprot:1967999-Prymnesium_polylepis.1